MRFFTREWCNGEHLDAESGTPVAAYAQYLDGLAARLPPDLLTLSQISLHDGHLKSLSLDLMTRRLALRLRCGDAQQGYFDLALQYADALVLEGTSSSLVSLINDPHTEVLYDEIDEHISGRFEHRMLLWPAGEIAIQFSAIALSRTNVVSREVP